MNKVKIPGANKLKSIAVKKLLTKFQKNYTIIRDAFKTKDLSKQKKFLRWLEIHQNFYSGSFSTISRSERKHLVEASLEIHKIQNAVRGKHIDESTVKLVVVSCDELIGLLERTKKAL